MPILLRIALRNLSEHKAKTLIIGILIAFGIFVLTIGNSLLVTAAQGVEKAYIQSFTGHVMVRAISDSPVDIGGAGGFSGDIAGQTIPDYENVYAMLETYPEVAALNPQITYFGRIDYSDEEKQRFAIAPVFGIDPDAYFEMFPGNLTILDGRFLEAGENGIVLPLRTVEDIRNELGIELSVGDELTFQAGGRSGLKIRKFDLVGIYEYVIDAGSTQPYAFIDAAYVRSMAGLVVGSQDVVDIDEADTLFLDAGSDDFFGSVDDFFSDDSFFSDPVESVEFELSDDNLFGILGDTSDRATLSEPSKGAWTYLLIRLENDNQTNGFIRTLNEDFAAAEMGVEAVSWSQASGGTATLNIGAQIFFYVIVAILAIVSVIIIMNTLVVSIIERTKEIGTMRSLGALRTTVRSMFILETMSISLVFGTIGMLLGVTVIWIVNTVGIDAPNEIFELLFGGSVLRPALNFNSILFAYLVMAGIGFLSSLYPVSIAMKIQPVQAMQSS
jgi:ABC-type lipoprotein release transport system permease subunit